MSNYTLLQSINEMCSMRKREEEEQINSLEPSDVNILSNEEAVQLASFIKEDLTDDGLDNDVDAVTEKAYSYVENIPGLEQADDQATAVRQILAIYFANDV